MNASHENLTLFPIRYKKVYDLYKKQLGLFWTVEEIDLSNDMKDWNYKLEESEKDFIKYILAFFAASDGIVIENLATRFYNEIDNSEGKVFYAFQMGMEGIHSEMYSLLIDTYVKDTKEKEKLLNAVKGMDVIKRKAEWAFKWIDDKKSSIVERILAFAIVEGIFFSGAFCSIFWLKDRGIMPGLCLSNTFISRDEGLHTEHACEQFMIKKRENPECITREKVVEMVESAVKIEDEFIEDALRFQLRGMNAILMKEYVRFVADRLLLNIGEKKIYDAKNPFDFMEKISLSMKENFFEGRNSQYNRLGFKEEQNNNYEYNQVELLERFSEFCEIKKEKIKEFLNQDKKDKLELTDDF